MKRKLVNKKPAVSSSTVIELRVAPNASRSEVIGFYGQAIKIKLKAPPVDGKANEALLEFLSEKLKLTKSQLSLESGESSRSKRIRIAGLSLVEIHARLGLQTA